MWDDRLVTVNVPLCYEFLHSKSFVEDLDALVNIKSVTNQPKRKQNKNTLLYMYGFVIHPNLF